MVNIYLIKFDVITAVMLLKQWRKEGLVVAETHSDYQLNLFQVVPRSTPRLHMYLANWSASCQLGFLTC